jgi:hypothetical protein
LLFLQQYSNLQEGEALQVIDPGSLRTRHSALVEDPRDHRKPDAMPATPQVTATCIEIRIKTMADFSHPWNAYASLQAELSCARRINNQSWGTEAAMNRVLLSLQDNNPSTSDEIGRAAASERRLERRRAHLRLVYLASSQISPHFENALAAKQELRIAQSKLPKRDWSVLWQVAVGYDYTKLASDNGVTPGNLRARVLRLRRRLAEKAA